MNGHKFVMRFEGCNRVGESDSLVGIVEVVRESLFGYSR
jgi:hypothetical protein